MQCVASSAANQRFYFVAVQLVSVLQKLQSSFQLFCRCFPPRVLNQHPAEIVARRAQGLALRAPGRFRRRAEAASAGCHARAMQQRHTPWTLRASPRQGSDVQGERNSVCSEASGE
jgi:hypothetical protein